jgi:peptidoglycan/xylan/chitin deacetylase (PgdA/CDA1 family)
MTSALRAATLLSCGLAGGGVLAADATRQATHGRVDLYVVDAAFNLGELRGTAFAGLGSCGWLGAGKERTGASCDKALGRDWEQVWLEFVPEGSGQVDIDLQGEWYAPEQAGDIRVVWADDVEVQGAEIVNPGFEDLGPDGRPAGWRFTGDFPEGRYDRSGRVAHGGRSCVGVWYGSQARQTFTVEAGRRYRVSAWFRVLDPTQIQEPPYVPLECPHEEYAQEVVVRFTSEEAARKATVRLEPLFEGYEWAVCSRWDDNNPDHERMRDVLARHGHRGTFYLNSLWPDWAQMAQPVDSAYGRALLRGGGSIGGHSLTHPLLSYCNRNRIFEETAGVRMVWEAAADMPVVSYSFSYCNFTNPHEGDVVHAAIARALERGGYYHVANEAQFEQVRTELMLSPIMPPDGLDIDPHVEAALVNDTFKAQHPNLTYSMHTWYRTPEAWARFEEQLEKYGHRPDWWYCNQNEYAAYRYQFARSRMTAPERAGETLRVRLRRPGLLDLNDATPLTFAVDGVRRDQIASVDCDTAQCRLSDRADGPFRFHLCHDRAQALPEKVGLIAPNTVNRQALDEADEDADFPGLRALLCESGGRLRLRMANGSDRPLSEVRVAYRLPLAWAPGVVRHHLADLAPGARRNDELELRPARGDYQYRAGSSFFAAQIDFRLGGRPGRLHVACYGTPTERDASYPQGGFLRLGPLVQGQVDLGKVTDDLQAGRIGTEPWVLPDDSRLEWQSDDDPTRFPWLDPDLTRVSGIWYQDSPGTYILRSVLYSPTLRQARLRCLAGSALNLFLNGQPVGAGEGVELREGDNALVAIVPQQVGFFLQVLEPDRDERVTDVRFERPGPAAVSEPYAAPAGGPVSRKALAGPWKAKLTQVLPAAGSIQQPHPDPGPSPLAQALIAPEADDSDWEEVTVPGRWLDYPGEWSRVDGEAVFRRSVLLPEEWAGRDLILSLGPIDDFDETYFDGQLVGRTDEATPDFYSAPRRYTVPRLLTRAGMHTLAVRIFDHFGDGGFTGAPSDLFIAPQ